jgi:putative heme-binding domain-containing protein
VGVFLLATSAGIGAVGAIVLGQAQSGRAVQTVAGVKFDTLPGFVIERVNPADKTDSYVALTFDSAGRPVVSKENDTPRILIDADKDGVYEGEQVFSTSVRNCQGLWFDGPALLGVCSRALTEAEIAERQAAQAAQAAAAAAGGRGAGGRGGGGGGGGGRGTPVGPAGIYRATDANSDGQAETFETVSVFQGSNISEHGPHAIRRAPDGSFSVITGNDATIADADLDFAGSPVLDVADPQLLPYLANFGRSERQGAHSSVYRWDPAIDKFTVLFGANRNAYDFAYNLHGEAFLFDSDMEWDLNLPWYREVRTVHGIPGGDYGYRDGSGKLQPWSVDTLPGLRDLGRGSPVGVEFYTSYAYPREFFDALFEADWSRGRLLYTALEPDGATYSGRTDRAEFIHGEPFNITDVEVGPDGLLYFTTGGRNTTGGFWRVRYTGPVEPAPDMTGILAVVRQPQPLSSWGWAAIERVKTSMGEAAFGQALEQLARDQSARGLDRARALYEMQRHGPAPAATLLQALVGDPNLDVRAAVVYLAGVQGGLARTGQASAVQPAAAIAAAGLRDGDPFVRRRAAEALVRLGQAPDRPSLAPVGDIYALLNDSDRFVRWAGRLLLERTTPSAWRDRVLEETNPLGAIDGMIAWVRVACPATPPRAGQIPDQAPASAINPSCPAQTFQPVVDKQLAMLARPLSTDDRIRLTRAIEFTAVRMEGGLTAEQRERVHALLVDFVPSGDDRLNREAAVLLAHGGQPGAIGEILALMPWERSDEPLAIHYLNTLRAIDQGWTTAQKEQLADALGRLAKWRGGAQFLNFASQIFADLEQLYATDAEKQMLYTRAPEFAPLTPEEIAAMSAPAGGRGGRGNVGGGGGGGGRGGQGALQARVGRGGARSRQEVFEENIFQPQQNLDPAAGRTVFEASCASCHRYGAVGNDHGAAALNLTTSPLRASKYSMLEAIVFPHRSVSPTMRVNTITMTNGQTVEGVVLQDGPTLSVLTANGSVQTIPGAQIRSREPANRSIMSEEQADALSQNDRRNLLAFLNDTPPPAQ